MSTSPIWTGIKGPNANSCAEISHVSIYSYFVHQCNHTLFESPAPIFEFVCWFFIKRLCFCFCLKQFFLFVIAGKDLITIEVCGWRGITWRTGNGSKYVRDAEGGGGSEEYWQRMKRGMINLKSECLRRKEVDGLSSFTFRVFARAREGWLTWLCLHTCQCEPWLAGAWICMRVFTTLSLKRDRSPQDGWSPHDRTYFCIHLCVEMSRVK